MRPVQFIWLKYSFVSAHLCHPSVALPTQLEYHQQAIWKREHQPSLRQGFAAMRHTFECLAWAMVMTTWQVVPVSSYCMQGASCWPTEVQWEQLGTSLTGKLHKLGIDKYGSCLALQNDAHALGSSAGGICMQYHDCGREFCSKHGMDNLPSYSVQAQSVADVQKALAFSTIHDVPVSIKTTGHSFLGSSTFKDSLLIWMKHFPKKSSAGIDAFTDSCGAIHASTIEVGGGEVWLDVYEAVGIDYDIVGGGSSSVSAAGGWLQGGGLSSLSRKYGMGIDNVLAFEVVLANGSLIVADNCTNPDLFWALRGGGGGTFGIVTGARYSVHPKQGSVWAQFKIGNSLGLAPQDIYRSWYEFWVAHSPHLDARWGGYWTLSDCNLWFTGSAADAKATLLDAVQEWHGKLPAAKQDDFTWSLNAQGSYYESRGGKAGLLSQTDGTGFAQMHIRSRIIPRSWLIQNSSEVVNILLSQLAPASCVDMDQPIAHLGIDLDCSAFAALYGVGGGSCKDEDILASANCDAVCQASPGYIRTRCPLTCGSCAASCVDMHNPLVGFGLPSSLEQLDCPSYAALFGVGGSGGCSVAAIRASPNCDASCKADPAFVLQMRCPVTCKVCTSSSPSDSTMFPLVRTWNYLLGGVMNDVPADATATNPAYRQSVWQIEVLGDSEPADTFAEFLRSRLPASAGAGAGYNHGDINEPDWEHAYWGTNLARLQALKGQFDPEGRLQGFMTVGYKGQSEDQFNFVSSVQLQSLPNQMRIAVSSGRPGRMEDPKFLTERHWDFKPMYSPEDTKIAFFRCAEGATSTGCYAAGTAIHVMAADGSQAHALTDYNYSNWNPSWMRDRSDRVIWTRLTGKNIRGWITCATCEPGSESQLSVDAELQDGQMEWAFTSFSDGRVLMIRDIPRTGENGQRTEAYALTIGKAGGANSYHKFALVGIDWSGYVHKTFLSASERYLVYIKNAEHEGEAWTLTQLFYCEVDKNAMTFQNEVAITLDNVGYYQWYPRMTPDDRYIIYSANGDGIYRIYAYELATETTRIVTQQTVDHWYPCPQGMTTAWTSTTTTVATGTSAPGMATVWTSTTTAYTSTSLPSTVSSSPSQTVLQLTLTLASLMVMMICLGGPQQQ
eukprot:TRINITY_DN32193_c0_g1_i1.p1 TRINITY_DN32193_c0_g1~~TRINITY_DN32193_c0_g1_i1.p1  ORF type:complete len:1137 (+),score=170.12 TRINITY_DN32193_c0_g1_i1:49-3411(+)